MTRLDLMNAVRASINFPVYLELSSGRTLPVPHPDYVVGGPPKSQIVLVMTDDENFNIVSLDQIVSVSRTPAQEKEVA